MQACLTCDLRVTLIMCMILHMFKNSILHEYKSCDYQDNNKIEWVLITFSKGKWGTITPTNFVFDRRLASCANGI